MSTPAAEAPSVDALVGAIRRGMRLSENAAISLREHGEFSNINYVYRVEVPGPRSLYLKVVPERPRRLPILLPRERVFSEAEGLRRFRNLAGDGILIPQVLFVDEQVMALAMSDVGEGRQVLFTVLAERFDLLGEHADALGNALGAVHGGTRGSTTPRAPLEEQIIRKVIFDGLLAPGAKVVFPKLWDEVNAEMQAHAECLVHGDLWSKNLLVRDGAPIAIVDFEGISLGDPAFDLGTLIAVALLPALEDPALREQAQTFYTRLLQSWTSACGSEEWAAEVLPRTFRATATFLASRGFGPFAYQMNDAAREHLRMLAASLAANPPFDLEEFSNRVAKSLS